MTNGRASAGSKPTIATKKKSTTTGGTTTTGSEPAGSTTGKPLAHPALRQFKTTTTPNGKTKTKQPAAVSSKKGQSSQQALLATTVTKTVSTKAKKTPFNPQWTTQSPGPAAKKTKKTAGPTMADASGTPTPTQTPKGPTKKQSGNTTTTNSYTGGRPASKSAQSALGIKFSKRPNQQTNKPTPQQQQKQHQQFMNTNNNNNNAIPQQQQFSNDNGLTNLYAQIAQQNAMFQQNFLSAQQVQQQQIHQQQQMKQQRASDVNQMLTMLASTIQPLASSPTSVQPVSVPVAAPLYVPVKSKSPQKQPHAAANRKTSSGLNDNKGKKNTGTGGGPWPATMKKYIERVLSETPAGKMGQAEQYVNKTVKEIIDKGQRFVEIDWNKRALPEFAVGKTQRQSKGINTNKGSNLNSGSQMPRSNSLQSVSSDGSSFGDANSNMNWRISTKGSSRTATTTNRSHEGKTSKYTSKFDKAPSPPAFTSGTPGKGITHKGINPGSRIEKSKREQRRQRFLNDELEEEKKKIEADELAREAALELENHRVANTEGDNGLVEWDQDEDTIVGTSGQLEKRYLRLTSAPDPATVRPLHVLRKSLLHLREKWDTEHNYTYLCDQLKSVRQDLTVQRIKNTFTVEVYEFHGRVAIQMGDMGEFNQCQGQLQELYNSGIEGSTDEFYGYRILYMVFTRNRTELIRTIANITKDLADSDHVKFALAARGSIVSNDYVKFFNLYSRASELQGKFLEKLLQQERVKAMKTLCKSYRPTVPVAYIAKLLFNDSVKECKKWLSNFNDVHYTEQGSVLDCKLSYPVFSMENDQIRAQGVDIKGQVH